MSNAFAARNGIDLLTYVRAPPLVYVHMCVCTSRMRQVSNACGINRRNSFVSEINREQFKCSTI